MTQVPRHWQDFMIGLGDPEWAHHPIFWKLGHAGIRRDITPEEGEEIQQLLRGPFSELLKQWTNAELWELCRRERIACQPVLTIPEVCEADHPQRARLADRRARTAPAAPRTRPPLPPLEDAVAGAGPAAAPRRAIGSRVAGRAPASGPAALAARRGDRAAQRRPAARRAAHPRPRHRLGRSADRPLPRRLRRGRDQAHDQHAALDVRRARRLRPRRSDVVGVDPAQPPLREHRPAPPGGPGPGAPPRERLRRGPRELRLRHRRADRHRLRGALEGTTPASS